MSTTPTQTLIQNFITLVTLLLTFIFFALLLWLLTLISSDRNRYKLPPSPPRLPIIGNFHQLGHFPHQGLALLAKKHGSLMFLKLGSVPTLVVSSAKSAREIFKSNDVVFSSRPSLDFFNTVFYGSSEIIMAPYGEMWRQLKSLAVLNLLSTKRVREYKNIRVEEMLLMIEEIERNCLNNCSFDLGKLFGSLTHGITSRVAFGRKYAERGFSGNGDNFKKLVEEGSLLAGAFNVGEFIPWLSWWNHVNGLNHKLKKLSQKLDFVLQEIIDDHIRKRHSNDGDPDGHNDVVDVMLELQELHNKTGEGMALSMDSIKGVVLDLFTAGIETTSTTLEWTMAELIKHPKIMKKAQQEVRTIVGNKNLVTNDNELSQMVYLKSVIKETFRLHPALPLLAPRETTSDVKILNYNIPSKTRVLTNAWAIGRDPNSWENPHEFDPERFLKDDNISSRDYKGQDFELIPFGFGRRGCPGMLFSVSIIELVLANLLLKFNWLLCDGAKVEELDMSEKFGVIIGRKCPLVVVAVAADTTL